MRSAPSAGILRAMRSRTRRSYIATVVFAFSAPLLAQVPPARLTVTSPTLVAGQPVPKQHTADGENISPALAWTGAPATAKQFALVCEDPDVPMPPPFVHWVIYKIPATAKGLPENIPIDPARRCRRRSPARCRACRDSGGRSTAAPRRRRASRTTITSSSTRSTPPLEAAGADARRSCSRRSRGTSSVRASSSPPTNASHASSQPPRTLHQERPWPTLALSSRDLLEARPRRRGGRRRRARGARRTRSPAQASSGQAGARAAARS